MKIVGSHHIVDFARQHADARSALESWVAETEEAIWKMPQDITSKHPKVSILPGGHIAIFDICGNKYRLATRIAYNTEIVVILNIGTHKEYDTWTF